MQFFSYLFFFKISFNHFSDVNTNVNRASMACNAAVNVNAKTGPNATFDMAHGNKNINS